MGTGCSKGKGKAGDHEFKTFHTSSIIDKLRKYRKGIEADDSDGVNQTEFVSIL